jgi:hypothetical protein
MKHNTIEKTKLLSLHNPREASPTEETNLNQTLDNANRSKEEIEEYE